MNEVSLALTFQSKHYPPAWHGKVPKRIRMATTIRPDFGLGPAGTIAVRGEEYEAWTNSHGAVCAICENGYRLGVKPYEFEVIEWHEMIPAGGAV